MNKTSTLDRVARPVQIAAGRVTLGGDLAIPDGARGIVLFAHGSGSSRHSPRNRFVAKILHEGGLATLLFDLLTEEEDQDRSARHPRFDIDLLARRLIAATDWLAQQPEASGLNVGYFGASTGAGAALVAAAERPEAVGAIVSRGGRPDLAGEVALARVRAPTLLIVGGSDMLVIALNSQAMAQMSAPLSLEIIPGASHLFEEAGTLQQVARRARHWFERFLTDQDQSLDGDNHG